MDGFACSVSLLVTSLHSYSSPAQALIMSVDSVRDGNRRQPGAVCKYWGWEQGGLASPSLVLGPRGRRKSLLKWCVRIVLVITVMSHAVALF